jgi:DnaJ-domain-containing protein 1
MGYVQLVVALLALYLFFRFLGLMSLLAWSLIRPSGRRDLEPVPPGPDDVDPMPVLDLKGFGYYMRMGRDRFGRMIYKASNGSGGFVYIYLDREASEEQRLGRTDRRRSSYASEGASSGAARQEPRMALGWKGFTADSTPWEILGVARDASISQIKAAYRKLITKYHPDRFSNLTRAEIDQLERDSKLINAAYSKLVKS